MIQKFEKIRGGSLIGPRLKSPRSRSDSLLEVHTTRQQTSAATTAATPPTTNTPTEQTFRGVKGKTKGLCGIYENTPIAVKTQHISRITRTKVGCGTMTEDTPETSGVDAARYVLDSSRLSRRTGCGISHIDQLTGYIPVRTGLTKTGTGTSQIQEAG